MLIGGGHTHVEVLRRFGMQPLAGTRITLISRDIHTPYSGMLPGLVAGHYHYDQVHIDLAPLAGFARARLYHDEVTGIDLERGQVYCRARPPVSYDVISIDSGATPAMRVPGACAHTVAVKPVSSFWSRWQQLRARVATRAVAMAIGVVGGGAGGVELMLAIAHRLRADSVARGLDAYPLEFHLLTSGADILAGHNPRARAHLRRALAAAAVKVHTHAEVTAVAPGWVHRADGSALALDEILWTTHAAAPAWPADSGLATDAQGFIRVDASLQSVSHVGVFAAGDIAAVDPHPRPKSGVFAVRQGPPLADNLRRALQDQPLRPFIPQRHFLSLISTGDRHAVASRGTLAVAGRWVWRWKDYIDRRFMARYAELPHMMMATSPLAPAELDPHMRCGGCGAKVGAELLHAALACLVVPVREDIVIGLAAPDDAAVVRLPAGALAVQSVDSFRAFIDDPWLFGRIAANHCLSDLYAMGATPQTALAIVTLPLAAPRKMRDDLSQMMRGANEVFVHAGTVLVGGHTGEGAELSLGFAINGYIDEHRLLRKGGAQPGDALVLCKPLGSGILLAGLMRGAIRARWLDGAYACMTQSNAGAADLLRIHGAGALTDVTGFGLAGHLLEMLRAGGVSGRITLASLPLLEGAAELAAAGIASTLAPENLKVMTDIEADGLARAHAHFALCFDPQTSGGLLGALPMARAADCVAALHAAGYGAAVIIGIVTNASPAPRLSLDI